MKTTFLLFLMLLFYSSVYGQEQGWRLLKSYKTVIDLTVKYLDGETVKSRVAKAGLKYNYIKTVKDKVYIKFLKITQETEQIKNDPEYANFVNANNDEVVYFVEKDKLNDLHKQKNSSLVSGTLLSPIKVRPEKDIDETNSVPWELSTDFTLGQYIGYRFPLSKTNPYYITVPTFTIGTSLLSINSSNTEPEAETSTTLGLTWSAGILLDLNGFNIGFLLGRDYAPGKAGKNWIYNEETWYSIGFGINLTSKNKDL